MTWTMTTLGLIARTELSAELDLVLTRLATIVTARLVPLSEQTLTVRSITQVAVHLTNLTVAIRATAVSTRIEESVSHFQTGKP